MIALDVNCDMSYCLGKHFDISLQNQTSKFVELISPTEYKLFVNWNFFQK